MHLLSTKCSTFLSLLITLQLFNAFPSLSINRPKYMSFLFSPSPSSSLLSFSKRSKYGIFPSLSITTTFSSSYCSMFGILTSSVHQPLLLAALFFLYRLPSNYHTFPSSFTNFVLCLTVFPSQWYHIFPSPSFSTDCPLIFPSLSSPFNNFIFTPFSTPFSSANPFESNNICSTRIVATMERTLFL